MEEEKSDLEIDFWNFPSSVGEMGDVLVSPEAKEDFEKDMRSKKINFGVLHNDIQRLIDHFESGVQRKEANRNFSAIDDEMKPDTNSKPRKRVFSDGTEFDMTKYNTWEEIETYLNKLPEAYPSLVSIHLIGTTHEGRNLTVVKISSNNSESVEFQKPAVWIDSGIHAREWITPATILFILDHILYSYQSSRSVKQYLDQIDWYILPVMNPDGYSYSHTHDRMWRKNRSSNNCTLGKKCCAGVDLNRNFDYFWGGGGSSSSRCSNTYSGSAPFSEPESRAVRDFVLKYNETIKAYLSYHSYAQSWRHPYAYRRNTYPEDIEELQELGNRITLGVQAAHNVRYRVYAGGKVMTGVARDWAKGEAKIKYVYCVELASRGSGFVAPTRAIVPSGEENWAALSILAEKIIEKYVNGSGDNQTEPTPTTSNQSNATSIPIALSTPAVINLSTPSTPPSPTPVTPQMPPFVAPTTAATPWEPGHRAACFDMNTDCDKSDRSRCESDSVYRALCHKFCRAC